LPGKAVNAGQWNDGFVHVTDIMPTILEIAKAHYPEEYNGIAIHPAIGKSIMPVLRGDSVTVHSNDGYGWELFEMKAYIKGNWKLLRLPQPMGTGNWELYDLRSDPAETTDLSAQYPEVKNQLIKEWNRYAQQNQVHDHQGHFDELYRRNYMPPEND
jgi:arylsulfatase